MYKLLYTPNIPFDMSDWECKQIKKVFAGENCIMAVAETGETLQKIKNFDCMSRTRYWTRIKQISISKWSEGAAIGLVEDGTCLISKRPIRRICEDRHLDFDHINGVVKSWTDVIQVEASDAYFALRSDGTVKYVSFCERYQEEYEDVKGWRDVIRIVTGVQNSIFGITKNGEVLVAGYNGMNVKQRLSLYDNAADVYPTGSECTDMYVLRTDGSTEHISGNRCSSRTDSKVKKLDGHFNYKVFAATEEQKVIDISAPSTTSVFHEKYKIVSFAVGDSDYSNPFIVAVAEL